MQSYCKLFAVEDFWKSMKKFALQTLYCKLFFEKLAVEIFGDVDTAMSLKALGRLLKRLRCAFLYFFGPAGLMYILLDEL